MPIELTGAHPPEHRLEPGDVLMVHLDLKDKKTKEDFTWKFFSVVVRVASRGRYVEHMVLDERERKAQILPIGQDYARVWYLPEAEWPDGVYAFRTKMILEGRIDIDL